MKEVAKAVALDLWVCHHFNVLPTESRFKQLTYNQKVLLFESFRESATDAEILYAARAAWDVEEAVPEDDLLRLGYSHEQVDRIKENLEKMG